MEQPARPRGSAVGGVDDSDDVTHLASLRTTGSAADAAGSGTFERGDALPTHVERYRVLMPLGSGATGVVVSAYDPDLDRKLALKLLHGDITSERTRRRLFREAQALARLSHPNVVKVYHTGFQDGLVFIATELIDGQSLWRWLRRRPRRTAKIIDAFVGAGRGLAAAHAAGIVHRDFKPANALVAPDGRVVVIDFGIAHALGTHPSDRGTESSATGSPESSTALLLRTAGFAGTPSYMAPEQFLGAPTDARTDQFSFCVALWEALCGRRPFEGDCAATIRLRVLSGELLAFPRDADVPASIRRALRRGLSRQPDARFPSMDALLDALGGSGRRRKLGLAVGLGALAGAAAVPAMLGDDDPGLCDRGEERVHRVWNDQQRDAIEDAFETTRTGVAEQAFTRLAALLDDYAARWVTSYQASCRATQVERTQSEAALDLRSRCLDQRLDALGHLVDVMAQADPRAVERSVAAALDLPSIADCDELDEFERTLTPPPSPAVAARIEGLEQVLRRAHVLRAAGDFQAAAARLRGTAAEATSLHMPSLAANLDLELGQTLLATGAFDEAAEALERAYAQGMTVGDDDTSSIAAIQLMEVHADHGRDFERGHQWGRLASALLDRHEGADRFYLHYAYATVYWRQGDLDRAMEHLGRARSGLSPEHATPSRTASLEEMDGILRGDAGEYDASLAASTRALEIQEELLGPAHPTIARLRNNMAAIRLRAGDPAAAERDFRVALDIWETAWGRDADLVAGVWSNLGVTQARQGRYEDAIASYERSLARYRVSHDDGSFEVARVFMNMSSAFEVLGEYAQAERLRRSALDNISNALGPDHPDALTTRGALGSLLVARGQHEDGLELLREVVEARTARHDPDAAPLVHDLAALGNALVDTGHPRDAIPRLRRALALHDDTQRASVRAGAIAAGLAAALVHTGHRGADVQGLLDRFEPAALEWIDAGEGHLRLALAYARRDPEIAHEHVDAGLAALPDSPSSAHLRERLETFRAELDP